MARKSVIKIKAEILIHYDRKTMGDTSRAETFAMALQQEFHKREGLEVGKWSAEHTTVEADVPSK